MIHNKVRLLVLTVVILSSFSNCAGGSAIYYSNNNTIILNGTNYPWTICKDISNESIVSRSGNITSLYSNISVGPDAELIIDGETFEFGGIYRIWNQGNLRINNSTITSKNSSLRGMILNRNMRNTGWIFELTNSNVSYLGPGGYDEYGETKSGIFCYPLQEDVGKQAKAPVIISNNNIHHTNGIIVGNVSQAVIISDNLFHEMEGNALTVQTADVCSNKFYNNTNYVLVFSYGNPIIRNNTFYNNHLLPAGSMIKIKEGLGGARIENNRIYNGSSDYTILIGSSNHVLWSAIKNNTIENVVGSAISLQGNGYNPGTGSDWEVKVIVENNTVTNATTGIRLVGYSNFNESKAPRNVTFKNNNIRGNKYGFVANGAEYINVTSDNDIITNNKLDIDLNNYYSSEMPKFINTKYNNLNINNEYSRFCKYFYLDVKIIDPSGNPIEGTVVNIENIVDNINYPPINIIGEKKYSFITNSNGHTPTPSDPDHSIAMLDYWQNLNKKTEMSYTITAEKEGYTSNITEVAPDDTWYRTNPNIPNNTITVVLPYKNKSGLIASAGVDQIVYKFEELIFNGSESIYNSEIISYEWDFDSSDGIQQDAIGVIVNHTYETAGTYIVTLTVTDVNGNTDSDTCTVTVLEKPEEIEITDAIIDASSLPNNLLPGENYTVDLLIDPSTPISGAQVDFVFDSSMISAKCAKEGDLFKQSGAQTLFSGGTIDDSTGKVKYIYGFIIGTSNVSSPGTMATVNLTAGNTTGIVEFNLSNVLISNASSKPVPCTVTGAKVLIDTPPVMNLICCPKTVDEKSTLSFRVSAKDSDGDTITYSASGLPEGASFDTTSGFFTWTPAVGQAGTYTFTFEVSDGYLTGSGNATVTVNRLNYPPIINFFEPLSGSFFSEGERINISVNASDADGQDLNYTIKIDGVICSTNPAYVWETDYTTSGNRTIEVAVSDGLDEVKEQHVIYINNYHPRWDVNEDGIVNILDITIIAQNYGTDTKKPYPRWDVNQDGVINIQDLTLAGYYFGEIVI